MLAPFIFVLGISGIGAAQAIACHHGTLKSSNVSTVCQCDEHWSHAGMSDVLSAMSGDCVQFNCQSDSHCKTATGRLDSSCPWHGWNCYCGWDFIMAGKFGPVDTGEGQCMGLMYTFMFWLTGKIEVLLQWLWLYFLVPSLLLLPVGRKRLVCDHNASTLWNSMRSALGRPPACTAGACITNPDGLTKLTDDYAWSIYALDLMVWSYVFISSLYLIVCTVWFASIWAMLAIVTLGTLAGGCCMMLGSMGGCEGHHCSCEGHNYDCCGTHDGCGSCDLGGANTEVFRTSTVEGGIAPQDLFWGAAGPFPIDHPLYGGANNIDCSGCFGGSVCDDCCCACCTRCCCCGPCRWVVSGLLRKAPLMPENMWGGHLGKYMGTHMDTSAENSYRGGNRLVEWLGMRWRRRADLHSEAEWRQEVAQYVNDPNRGQGQMRRGSGAEPIVRIGRSGTFAVHVDRPFSIEKDRCVPSSFEDYKTGTCWICQGTNDEWDLWMSCRHIFCAECSSQMLLRVMPCPLCRIASTSVLRGESFSQNSVEAPPMRGTKDSPSERQMPTWPIRIQRNDE